MKVFLIGMPGAGKSTLGPELAAHLNYSFSDLDIEIEKAAGLPIPEIFAKRGEAGFRQLEAEALKTVANSAENLVVATGGGTPCYSDNLAYMHTCGITVYLKAEPKVLEKRLFATDLKNRPLLKEKSSAQLLTYLEQTLQLRLPFYQQAGIIFEASQPANAVGQLADFIRQFLQTA